MEGAEKGGMERRRGYPFFSRSFFLTDKQVQKSYDSNTGRRDTEEAISGLRIFVRSILGCSCSVLSSTVFPLLMASVLSTIDNSTVKNKRAQIKRQKGKERKWGRDDAGAIATNETRALCHEMTVRGENEGAQKLSTRGLLVG